MRWGLVCLLVLALTAGCNTLGGSEAAGTLTPAPVPTGTGAPDLPPGVSTTGVADRSLLVDSHVRAARATNWVWNESNVIVQTSGNRTVTTVRRQTVRYVDDGTYYHERVEASSFVARGRPDFYQRYRRYADGRTAYESRYSMAAGGATFDRDDTPRVDGTFAGFAADQVRNYLAVESATVARVDVGDRPHYEVISTEPAGPVPNYGGVETYRARAVVREDGFVRRLNVTYSLEQGSFEVEGRYRFVYREVGTATIDRPDWVDDARNRTGP